MVLLYKFQHEDFSKRAKGFNINWIEHYHTHTYMDTLIESQSGI